MRGSAVLVDLRVRATKRMTRSDLYGCGVPASQLTDHRRSGVLRCTDNAMLLARRNFSPLGITREHAGQRISIREPCALFSARPVVREDPARS